MDVMSKPGQRPRLCSFGLSLECVSVECKLEGQHNCCIITLSPVVILTQ